MTPNEHVICSTQGIILQHSPALVIRYKGWPILFMNHAFKHRLTRRSTMTYLPAPPTSLQACAEEMKDIGVFLAKVFA